MEKYFEIRRQSKGNWMQIKQFDKIPIEMSFYTKLYFCVVKTTIVD